MLFNKSLSTVDGFTASTPPFWFNSPIKFKADYGLLVFTKIAVYSCS